MKISSNYLALFCLLIISISTIQAQTTSWTGTTNTNWNNSNNWTNGSPGAASDVILGDANFTGPNHPNVNKTSNCKSITIGGAVATILTVSKNLTVDGDITINANGTISHPGSTVTLTGNWINNGSYTTTNNAATLIFNGVTQSISGSVVTTFRKLEINTISEVTLASNVNISGTQSYLYVYGTLNPGEAPTYTVTSSVATRVFDNGTIKVNAATFAGNYSLTGTVTLDAGSIVEYASTSTNQTVSNAYTYSTLIISGTGVKSLAGNLSALNSSNTTVGRILVNSATFDLLTFTANRGTPAGGEIFVANGAFLKIGGTNTFPANFSTNNLSLSSTVEYYGNNQAISSKTYGNLNFSSAAGAATKTMPATAFSIEGDFASNIGTGTSVSYTSAASITFNGMVTIGAATTFNGSTHTHTSRDNWINNGTFTGATSSIIFDGPGLIISGSGTHNFNNITFTSSLISAASGTTINVAGNITTTGAGEFTHNSGGLISMTGTAKSISGASIIFNDLTISGTVTSASSFTINSNFSVSGSFSGTGGTVIMTGSSKAISGAGTIGFGSLTITGTIATASSFSLSTLFSISGSFTASAGTATFTSTSILSGIANLFNVTINGTSFQLSSGAQLGIANTFTITAGTLNVASTTPNTVNFNGSGAQSVNAITYHHLLLSNGNTKTAAGGITVNGNLTIASATTFAGGTGTHTILRNWINSGTYTTSTGTVQFTGTNNATLAGATTFNILTINKSIASTALTLNNNVTAATVNMTSGMILTGSNSITITTTRTNNGIILGTIIRTHSFATSVAYAFEGPDNTILFSSVSGVTSITVTVTIGSIGDFPDGASINREYAITIPSGTYNATLRLHYEDAELNGTNESAIKLWKYAAGTWSESGKTGNNTTTNYIEQSGLTNISNRWTCSEIPPVVRWNGSISSDWNNAANWTVISGTPSTPPTATDIVRIGTGSFTNHPTITSSVTIKGITFGSVQAATLTLGSGGALTVNGNISGSWSADAIHTINTGVQDLRVYGNLQISNGTANQSINCSFGNGTITVLGDVIQKGNAAITFTGTGMLNIGGNYNYTGGTLTAGSGTIVYNGSIAQTVAPLTYNNLTINKSAGIATLSSSAAIAGNLLVSNGVFSIDFASATIGGNVTINSGATLDCDGATLIVGGNWSKSGTYITTSGSATFNGTGAQTISAGNFNILNINKASGTATLTGNNTLTGNLNIQSGTLDLVTFTANRSTSGGALTIAAGATLIVGGSTNFPSNYTVNTLNATSFTHYNGSVTQTVAAVTYGNISFSNGSSNAKTFAGNSIVNGDIVVNSGATSHSGGFTISLAGNWTNNGTFTPTTGTILLNGVAKTITGNTTFNHVTVSGSYSVAGSNISYNGNFEVVLGASFAAGSGIATVNANLTNRGSLTSIGTTIFSGTVVQTLRLINALASSSDGVVNFNGTVAPVLNSTSAPQFATLNINNTTGISPSIGWTVFVAMNVNSGAKFYGGTTTHNIYGSFTNAGTVTSTGRLNFIPFSAKTINFGSSGFSSTGIVNFGGAGQITLAGTPGALRNIIISNTNSAGVTPSSNWIIDSTLSISSNSIFNASSYAYTVGGNIQSDGRLNGSTSTFTMSSTNGFLTASASTEFNHFIVAGRVTPQTDFKVAGNFTNNGIYDGSIGVLIMSGSNAATIGGTVTPSPIAQLTIEKTGSAVVTQTVNINSISFLNIFSGVLFTGAQSLTQDASGGILIISDGATLRLGGTNTLPGFSGFNLDVNSNVDYAGTAAQSIANAATYGNLLLTSSFTRNAFTPLIIAGNLIISNGALNTSTTTVTHSIAGNFMMTGGTLTGTNPTYILNGTGSQTLSVLSSLVRLTINKSSGTVVLGSDISVSIALTLTAGKIDLSNYNCTILPSAGITGISPSNYFIAEGTGAFIQQVAAGETKLFPVGSSSNYYPASITLTGGSTTDNFSVRVKNQAYRQGETGSVVNSNVVRAIWVINETVPGGSNATITLQWPLSMEASGFNRSLSRLARYTGTTWDYGASDIAASGSNPYTVTLNGFTVFGPFAVAMLEALPVTWLNISGTNLGDGNKIFWSTASESNNNYFEVEASLDGIRYDPIGRIIGAGNSVTTRNYSFVHQNINGNSYFYRIKQVDIDEKFSYSKTIKIIPSLISGGSLNIYPNPVKDNFNIGFFLQLSGSIKIELFDAAGKLIHSGSNYFTKGKNNYYVDCSNKPAGLYSVVLTAANGDRVTGKVIKH